MKRTNDSGQATVELALCLPFLALLVAALVELGLVVGDEVRLEHAAREAARVASVDADPVTIRAAAEETGLRPLDMEVEPTEHFRVQGEPVTVTVSYSPPGHLPLIGRFFGGLVMHAEATMRIERP